MLYLVYSMKKIIIGLLLIILFTSCSNRIKEFYVWGDLTIYNDNWDVEKEVNVTNDAYFVKNNAYKLYQDLGELRLNITIKRGDLYLPYTNLNIDDCDVYVRLYAYDQNDNRKVVDFNLINISDVRSLYRLNEGESIEIILRADPESLENFNSKSEKPFEECIDKEYAELWMVFEN